MFESGGNLRPFTAADETSGASRACVHRRLKLLECVFELVALSLKTELLPENGSEVGEDRVEGSACLGDDCTGF